MALSTRKIIHNNSPYDQHTETVNLKTIKKILYVLLENGRIKRTHLSAQTGMNYKRCMKYINTLKMMKLVEVLLDDDYYVMITKSGKELFNLLDYV